MVYIVYTRHTYIICVTHNRHVQLHNNVIVGIYRKHADTET